MKTLIFEGAGWADADISKLTDVGNCRIRTRLRNNDGRVIYLEILQGHNQIPSSMHVDFCFYNDSKWDSNRSHSSELSKYLHRADYDYSKVGLLNFVNQNLDCSFESVQVINDDSINVHQTHEPLCSCAIDGYTPYRDEEFFIFALDGIESMWEKDKFHGMAKYRLSYRFVKKTLKWWFSSQHDQKVLELAKKYTFYVKFRWNKSGKIHSAEISAIEPVFPCCEMGIETVKTAIDEVIRFNGKKECVRS